MKIFLTIVLFMGTGLLCRAQHSVSGRVVDKTTREPMEGAVIRDRVSGKTVLTDRLGQFRYSHGSPDSLNFEASFIGYRTRQLRLVSGDRETLIELERSALDMTAVTITGNPGRSSTHTLSRIDLNLAPARTAH